MDEPKRQAPIGGTTSQPTGGTTPPAATPAQTTGPSTQAEKAGRAAQERGADLARQAQGRASEVTRSATDRTTDLARDAEQRAGKVAEAAQSRASDIVQQAREGVTDIASSVQDRLGETVGPRKEHAAEAIDTAAQTAHKAADSLRDADQRWLSDVVGAGADELSAFAEMIRGNDLNGLLQRIRGVARRQPALFAGASVAAGFALARMARVALEQPSHAGASDWSRQRSHPASSAGSDTFAAPMRATSDTVQTQTAQSAPAPIPGRDAGTTPPAASYPGTTYNG